MTVLHSALIFIEENLPKYYEQREKSSPLLEQHFTPNFNSKHVITTTGGKESAKFDGSTPNNNINGGMPKSFADRVITQTTDELNHTNNNNEDNTHKRKSRNEVAGVIDEKAREDMLFFVENITNTNKGAFEKFKTSVRIAQSTKLLE